jgi:hypothetical protein
VAQKRLYTEADVAAMPRGAALVLGKATLATPSALELAFIRGITVSYADGATVDGAQTVRADALTRMLAQDGTYVVTVQRGRAVLTRLVDGAPTAFGTVP